MNKNKKNRSERERERERERVEFVEIIEYISVVFDRLLVDDCILIY